MNVPTSQWQWLASEVSQHVVRIQKAVGRVSCELYFSKAMANSSSRRWQRACEVLCRNGGSQALHKYSQQIPLGLSLQCEQQRELGCNLGLSMSVTSELDLTLRWAAEAALEGEGECRSNWFSTLPQQWNVPSQQVEIEAISLLLLFSWKVTRYVVLLTGRVTVFHLKSRLLDVSI